MSSRVRAHPFLTLMAVISAVMILAGRVNRTASWGEWLFFGGIAVLVLAGVLFILQRD